MGDRPKYVRLRVWAKAERVLHAFCLYPSGPIMRCGPHRKSIGLIRRSRAGIVAFAIGPAAVIVRANSAKARARAEKSG